MLLGWHWLSGFMPCARIVWDACDVQFWGIRFFHLLLVVERVVLVQDGGVLKGGLKLLSLRMTPIYVII